MDIDSDKSWMSKNRLHQEVDDLRDEVRTLRDRTAQLEQELAYERQRQGTAQFKSAYQAHTQTTDDDNEILRVVQEQRNRYRTLYDHCKTQLDDVTWLLNGHILRLDEDERKSYAEYSSRNTKFEELSKGNAPVSLVWIQESYRRIEKDIVSSTNALATTVNQRGYQTIGEGIRYIIGLAKKNAATLVGVALMDTLIAIFHDPHLVCREIIEELDFANKTRIETVSRLDLEWAKKHITGGRPITHSALREGLQHAYWCEKSGFTQEVYAPRNNQGIASLQKYSGYLKRVRENAKKADTESSLS